MSSLRCLRCNRLCANLAALALHMMTCTDKKRRGKKWIQ